MRATTPWPLALLLVLTAAIALPGQESSFPKGYFRSPLGIPLELAGNFAEMRDNHFHGGLDIKTNDAEGYRVYAAAAGYISRVKVSPYGYGNALYLSHPNGYTTVYGHVARFKGPIAGYVKSLQMQRKSFEVDQYLQKDRFPVQKGDVIALSGNSGSSSGPHLHFEIRKTAGQVPVNPMLFGLDIPDTIPPRIYRVRAYPRDDDSGVELRNGDKTERASGRQSSVTVSVTEVNGRLSIDAASLRAWGHVGFGIQTHDYHNGSRNRLGVFSISLDHGDTTIFQSKMEEMAFGNTRYINAHVDYAERQSARRWIQRSFLLPGNELPIYKTVQDGILAFAPGKLETLTYTVHDANDNSATLSFVVEGVASTAAATTAAPEATESDDDGKGRGGSDPADENGRTSGTNGHSVAQSGAGGDTVQGSDHTASEIRTGSATPTPDITPVRYASPVVLRRPGVEALFPAKTFYDDFELSYLVEPILPGGFSPVHVLHNDLVPVHRRYDLSIAPTNLPESLRAKSLVATIGDDGKVSSVGGSYEAGVVKTRLRSLGKFFITVDTLAPSIRSLDVVEDKPLGRRQSIRFIIDDDLSGIAQYNGYIDGKWALFAYDAKSKTMYHELDAGLKPGRHTVSIVIEDHKGNSARLDINFRR